MLLETNKALLIELFEAIGANNFGMLEKHPGFWQTREVLLPMHHIFTDWRAVHGQQIAEGDKVFTYSATHMTHIGTYAGVPPTGKRVTLEFFSLDRVVNGIVVEHNGTATWPDVLRQLRAPGFESWPRCKPRLLTQHSSPLSPSLNANKQVVLQWWQRLSQDMASKAKLRNGLGELRAQFEEIHATFPDLEATVINQIAEEQLVATHATLHGTHRGSLFGFPPTGKTITWDQYLFNRVVDGEVVEHIGAVDWTAALIQVGLYPALAEERPQPA